MELIPSQVTTLAAAAVIIKIFISGVKFFQPAIGTPSTMPPVALRVTAVLLGVAAACIMKVGLFTPADGTHWALVALNYLLGGVLVGFTAMGTQEGSQLVTPKSGS